MSSTLYEEQQAIELDKVSYNWPMITTLFLLLAIPGIPAILIVGSVVIGLVSNELPLDFVNHLYISAPWAVIVHGTSGIVFFLTVPLQFSSGLRRRYKKLHKYSGYLAFISGFVMALSGVWMHHVLTPEEFGPRYMGLVLMSIAMCASFSIALVHIIKRNVAAHKTWVTRAVAVTLGAITYLFVEVVLLLTVGQIGELKPMLLEFLHQFGRITAVMINIIAAEFMIRNGRIS